MTNLSLTSLTKREYQVTEALAWGAAEKEVPYLIQIHYGGPLISVDTVKSIKKHVYTKWGIQKVNELTAVYMHLHYKISLENTPLARLIVVLAMFIISAPSIIQPNDFQRQFQSRSARISRAARTTRGRDNTFYLPLC